MAIKKPFVKMKCTECKRINYYVRRSKKMVGQKLELKKFCRWCRKHTPHKQAGK